MISHADGVVYCTSLGPVGFAKNGVALYNALTGQTTDAVKNEVFDSCDGHSSPDGSYHYHKFPGLSSTSTFRISELKFSHKKYRYEI